MLLKNFDRTTKKSTKYFEVSEYLGYYDVIIGKQFLGCQRIFPSLSNEFSLPKKTAYYVLRWRQQAAFESSVTLYKSICHNIPEDFDILLHHCGYVKSNTVYPIAKISWLCCLGKQSLLNE
jgi:hypothetical protein